MFMDYSDMLSIDELCSMLRIGRNKAYLMLKNKEINAFKNGRLWMIPKEAVIEYVANRGTEYRLNACTLFLYAPKYIIVKSI